MNVRFNFVLEKECALKFVYVYTTRTFRGLEILS